MEPCLLDDVCLALGLDPMTRMREVLQRILLLQYYYAQLIRCEMMAEQGVRV